VTTATVPITITCPDWCQETAEHHAAEIWENGGECFHHMPERMVTDPKGIQRPLTEPKMCDPIELRLVTTTRGDDGHECESPIVYIETASEHTIEQALALADAIRDMVKQYRAAGGVA
jgi:hypothetical protein